MNSLRFRVIPTLLASLGILFSAHAFSASTSSAGPTSGNDDFDRLDGTGASGKRVDVVEWEGNLEIHVYPAGSLKGLGLKLDKKNKSKPVMVIAYRFGSSAKDVLVRRAILGIDLQEGFKTYRDPTETEFDKIIISNNGLSGQVASFRLDPEPTQLYPDGVQPPSTPGGAPTLATDSNSAAAPRRPASARGAGTDSPAEFDQDSGSIRPFFAPTKN